MKQLRKICKKILNYQNYCLSLYSFRIVPVFFKTVGITKSKHRIGVRNKYIILSVFTVLLFSCKRESKDSVAIKGRISNLQDSEIVVSYLVGDSMRIDTVAGSRNGKFTYIQKIDTLTAFSFYFNRQSSSVMVFANPGDRIRIKGDAHLSDLIKVNGNEINDDLSSFKELNGELLRRRSLLLQNLLKESPPDSLRSGRTLTESDQIDKVNSLNQELRMSAEEHIRKNPAKWSSLILIDEFFTNSENPEALRRVMDYLQDDLMKSSMGMSLKNYSERISRSAENSYMPYFQLTDKSGKTVRSSDFQGKHLLLSFVSTAGIESRETIRSLKRIYPNLNKDSVRFLSVYIDSDLHPVEYIESDSIPWTVVAEKKSWASHIVEAYNIEFVPNNILISSDGIIRRRNIPAVAVESMLRKTTGKNR